MSIAWPPAATGLSSRWRDRDRRSVAQVYGRYTGLVVQDADRFYLIDVDGRRYLDFACGVGVTLLGHRHPDVARAVHRQIDSYWHISTVAQHARLTEAAEKVASVCPEPLDTVFFANSGADVVEGALKLARFVTRRQGIICFTGGFHGRTFAAATVTTTKVHYRKGFAPLLPGVYVTSYPYCFHTCQHGEEQPCPIAAGREIEQLFKHVVPADEVAAILVEPIQGDGGYVVPPSGFLSTLRRICDDNGIVLVCDEAQSGVGRTGLMLASEHEGVVPDIVTLAKALGNGMPISALVARRGMMDAWPSGSHGSTFGGNAVSCAAVVATLDVIQRDGLLHRATEIGDRIVARAHGWQQQDRGLADVRGRGTMVGLEFLGISGLPDSERVATIRSICLERGLVVLSCGLNDNVIRLIPPLILDDNELERGLGILEEAVFQSSVQS